MDDIAMWVDTLTACVQHTVLFMGFLVLVAFYARPLLGDPDDLDDLDDQQIVVFGPHARRQRRWNDAYDIQYQYLMTLRMLFERQLEEFLCKYPECREYYNQQAAASPAAREAGIDALLEHLGISREEAEASEMLPPIERQRLNERAEACLHDLRQLVQTFIAVEERFGSFDVVLTLRVHEMSAEAGALVPYQPPNQPPNQQQQAGDVDAASDESVLPLWSADGQYLVHRRYLQGLFSDAASARNFFRRNEK